MKPTPIPPSGPPSLPPPWQPRFSLKALFLATLVVCAVGTAAAYLVRSNQGGKADRFTFILFTLAAPALLVVVVSLVAQFFMGRRR